MKKAVSIKDIAAALGLSRNTVSKALNGQFVSEKTRELVLRKASELNYKSINCEIIREKKYRLLLLSGKPLANFNFFVPIVQSIQNFCFDRHFDLFIYTYTEGTTHAALAEHIRSLNIDGVVAMECFDPAFIRFLMGMKIPTCFIDFPGIKFDLEEPFDLICTSDQKLICEYAKTLILDHGLRRFSFVGDFRHCLSFHERYMGLLRAFMRTDRAHNSSLDIIAPESEFDYGNVEAMKEKIRSFKELPDCFVCANDFIARIVIRALKSLGRVVPDDCLVTGFDGTPIANSESPTITTFDVDKENIGFTAARTLIDRIERKNSPTKTIMINAALKVAESTAHIGPWKPNRD